MAGRFKPGDIVELKSGGPAMTVERIHEGSDGTIYYCSWFAGAKDNSRGFREEALDTAAE